MRRDDQETVSEYPDGEDANETEIEQAARTSGAWRVRAAEAFAAGTVVDSIYRVVRQVGEGAMGVVLRAHDMRLDRDVAMKVIRPAAEERPGEHERFLAEARAMARVRHPNVVEVYALGEWLGLPYIVMEYVHGPTLDDWLALREEEPPTIDEAMGILDQLCLGVEAIHASGAAHRDLKAGNVLLGPGFRVVVADFGIARDFRQKPRRSGVGSGTPATMAPEVVLGTVAGPRALERVDVYAVGVLAYRLLVGRYPFNGASTVEMLAQHVSERPPPPLSVRPELPLPFERVLLEALEKSPARRTASVAQLRAALHAARGTPGPAPSHLRFLVVDDDAPFRDLLAEILVQAFPGAIVEEAADGLLGLAAAEQNIPTAIITDLDMPRMSGFELTAAVRGSKRLAAVPVLVVTGRATSDDWHALSQFGADAFLVKPFDGTHAVAILRAILDRPRVVKKG